MGMDPYGRELTAYTVMANIAMAYRVMAYIAMPNIGMVHTVMVYILVSVVLAYI